MAASKGLQGLTFSDLFKKHPRAVAVAVSGGPDSMALLHRLSTFSGTLKKPICIHALTVDHGLRAEAAKEARQVAIWVAGWPHVDHRILKWKGKKPVSAIQEMARRKRYEMMAGYCADHDIRYLFLAHHQADQAETFLFRLAKGSGLDGLSGMAEITPYNGTDLLIMRPMLGLSKQDILTYCADFKIPHVQDPSNKNTDYARVRLRQSLPVLEAEGLSEKRLVLTAKRLQRAREALEFYTDKIMRGAVTIEQKKASIRLSSMTHAPEDIRVRVVRQVLSALGADGYGPRLERLEELLDECFTDITKAKRFTLGGFLFTPDVKKGFLRIEKE